MHVCIQTVNCLYAAFVGYIPISNVRAKINIMSML